MSARARVGLCWVVLLAAVMPGTLRAHAFAPSLLELRETATGSFEVRFKQPKVRRSGSELRPKLPDSCQARDVAIVEPSGTGMVARWPIACDAPLVGETIVVDGIADSQADVLVRVSWLDGRSIRHVLRADAPSFQVPARVRAREVMARYAVMGFEHILTGVDHLLFVFGLVLLVHGRRRLLLTITAFTVGHSVTLALASLGFVRLPSGPIEALIAFSIYLLAVELARAASARAGSARVSWLGRSPGWMAAGFGLLHGLGFAGALSEVGLPQGEIPVALLAFNLGIEAGQIAFVGVVLLARAGWRRVPVAPSPRWALAPAYVIGCLAAYWTLERLFA